MVSSRSKQRFKYKGDTGSLLSAVRTDLANIVEKEKLFGEELFEVWINEPAPALEASEDLWEACLDQVRRADLVIILYNGDAGWAKAGGEIGICHAELQEALNTARAKIRLIQLSPLAPKRKGDDGRRDTIFRDYVDKQHLFTGAPSEDGEQVIELCRKTLREAVAQMVQLGVREARKGKFYSGDALDWSRLDFRRRRQEMRSVVKRALEERGGVAIRDDPAVIAMPIRGQEVLVICSAVSGSFSIPEAREGVNQLFLRDFEHSSELNAGRSGPIHMVACHRSITESQAIRQLGFPDATTVSAPFGVYIADSIQNVQLFFLANCRDPTTTMYQVQRVFDWMDQVGEGQFLLQRGAARARIVQAIAKEQAVKTKHAGR
jgi:hypothetical protein